MQFELCSFGKPGKYANGLLAYCAFQRPSALVLSPTGAILVADTLNHCIREVNLAKNNVKIFAGVRSCLGLLDGPVFGAKFNQPGGMATSPDGDVYVVDAGNRAIRHITGPRGNVRTLVVVPSAPRQILWTPDGILCTLADSPQIFRIRNNNILVFAGTTGSGFVDGPSETARFGKPAGLAFDPLAGCVYVSDSQYHCIRKITSNGQVSTLAGGKASGYRDGPAADALFLEPQGLAMTPSGALLVAEPKNHRLRCVQADGYVVTYAVAEPKQREWTCCPSPDGILVLPDGTTVMTSLENHRIYVLKVPSAYPFLRPDLPYDRRRGGIPRPETLPINQYPPGRGKGQSGSDRRDPPSERPLRPRTRSPPASRSVSSSASYAATTALHPIPGLGPVVTPPMIPFHPEYSNPIARVHSTARSPTPPPPPRPPSRSFRSPPPPPEATQSSRPPHPPQPFQPNRSSQPLQPSHPYGPAQTLQPPQPTQMAEALQPPPLSWLAQTLQLPPPTQLAQFDAHSQSHRPVRPAPENKVPKGRNSRSRSPSPSSSSSSSSSRSPNPPRRRGPSRERFPPKLMKAEAKGPPQQPRSRPPPPPPARPPPLAHPKPPAPQMPITPPNVLPSPRPPSPTAAPKPPARQVTPVTLSAPPPHPPADAPPPTKRRKPSESPDLLNPSSREPTPTPSDHSSIRSASLSVEDAAAGCPLPPLLSTNALLRHFEAMSTCDRFADAVFVAHHQHIPVHRAVLACRSPVLRTTVEAEDHCPVVILVNDASPMAVRLLVRYLYTEELELEWVGSEDLRGLMLLCLRYQLPAAYQRCLERCRRLAGPENMMGWLDFSVAHQLPDVKPIAMLSILKHFKSVQTHSPEVLAPLLAQPEVMFQLMKSAFQRLSSRSNELNAVEHVD